MSDALIEAMARRVRELNPEVGWIDAGGYVGTCLAVVREHDRAELAKLDSWTMRAEGPDGKVLHFYADSGRQSAEVVPLDAVLTALGIPDA